jgi:uncharacterized repeat protein (TIGR03803 family)
MTRTGPGRFVALLGLLNDEPVFHRKAPHYEDNRMSREPNKPDPREVEALFARALPLSLGERAAFLEGVCGTDAGLRNRVEALLRAQAATEGFLPERARPHLDANLFAKAAPQSGSPGEAAGVAEAPGQCIGRYKLREKIGEGGCGVVYVAEQEEPVRRRVALKVIKLGMDTRTGVGAYPTSGVVFKVTLDGSLTTVVSFNGTNGANPWVGLMQASDGNFYGTTRDGGDFVTDKFDAGLGTVFQLTPDGALNTLFTFDESDGYWPETPLVQGSDGNLYGTTFRGGDLSLNNGNGFGTVFRIVMPPPAPSLTLQFNGNPLVLSWPTNAVGFTLQFALSLNTSTDWFDSIEAPAVVADRYVLTQATTNTAQFYCLKK